MAVHIISSCLLPLVVPNGRALFGSRTSETTKDDSDVLFSVNTLQPEPDRPIQHRVLHFLVDSSSSSSDTSSDDSQWSDILGPNWRFTSDISLLSVGSDSSSSDSGSDSGWSWSSGAEGDDETSGDSDNEDTADQRPFLLRRWIQLEIDDMHQNRYEQPRNTLPRGPSYLHHVLMALKAGRPDHFRQNLRVSPITFDALVAALEDDPVFASNSNHPQLPVEQQVAVALF
ncbi:hypothetical protein DFH09DRAFT_1340535 [Mycena vulgaris]|nr:hypothetical protein DFH09DRAFT_1340535 [Mycena vulgaris]